MGTPPFRTVEEAAILFGKVEAAKREWETTFDSFEDGIGILRKDGTFNRVNTALAGMVGLDVRDLPGRPCCEVFAHHRAVGCPARIGSGHREVEFEVSAPWRRVYREAAYAVPGLDSTVVIIHDITKQRLAEERIRRLHEEAVARNATLETSMRQLRETQERLVATEKLASLATLSAGLAHEINNPLGFVTSGVTHLRDRAERLAAFVSAFTGGAVKSDLDRLVREGDLASAGADLAPVLIDVQAGLDRIRRIVAAFSAFVDPGPVATRPVDLNEVVREAVAKAEAGAGKGTGLKFIASYADLPEIEASFAGLESVVSQLLENATWAVRSTGRAGRVVVGTGLKGDDLFVAVQDNGIGMPPEVAAHCLDPFFTTRAPGPHVGLGLTIAQAVARRHGGELAVKSEPGKGTTVEVTLPRVAPAASARIEGASRT